MVELHLIVDGNCIETEAKRLFNRLVSYLLDNEDPEKEIELELLRRFLENANFNELRKHGLDGRVRKHVVLRSKLGSDGIEMCVLEDCEKHETGL